MLSGLVLYSKITTVYCQIPLELPAVAFYHADRDSKGVHSFTPYWMASLQRLMEHRCHTIETLPWVFDVDVKL